MLNSLSFDLITVGFMVVITCVLGFTVYFSNPTSITHRYFLRHSLVAAAWGFVNYLSYQTFSDKNFAIWIIRLVIFLSVFHTFYSYELFSVFPLQAYKFSWKHKYLFTPLVYAVSLLTLTPLVFHSIQEHSRWNVPTVKEGVGVLIFVALILYLSISIFALLFKKYFTQSENKQPLLIILIGILTSYSLILLFNLIMPTIFLITKYIPYSSLFLLPSVILTAYAILKHKILNIQFNGSFFLIIGLLISIFLEIVFLKDITNPLSRGLYFSLVLILSVLIMKIVIREIQQKKENEILAKKLEAAHNRLQEVDKLKTALVSLATHDICSPLTAIKGYVSLIKEDSDTVLSPQSTSSISSLEKVTDNLTTIVTDFLDVHKIDQEGVRYTFSPCDFRDILNDVITEITPLLKRRNISFSFYIENDDIIKVSADKEKLEHALKNIFENSIKYSSEGEINTSVSVNDDMWCTCVISDNSVRSMPVTSSKLTEKLSHDGSEDEARVVAHGLGLYAAREIIKEHGGKMLIKCDVHGSIGVEYTVKIPILST